MLNMENTNKWFCYNFVAIADPKDERTNCRIRLSQITKLIRDFSTYFSSDSDINHPDTLGTYL